jgi:predicted DNA-binding transcriptional regulator AlpA
MPLQARKNPSYRDMQQLLKAQDLAAIINVSTPTIMNWYYGDIIPARIHVGRVIRFELEPVLAALDKIKEAKQTDDFFRRRRTQRRGR